MTKLLSNRALSDASPRPDLSDHELADFAGTFPLYQWWGGVSAAGAVANPALESWRSDGSLPVSLTELRTCLAFEHRRWRHFGEDIQPEEPEYGHALYRAIRQSAVRGAVESEDEYFAASRIDAGSPRSGTDAGQLASDLLTLAVVRLPKLLAVTEAAGGPMREAQLQVACLAALLSGLPGDQSLTAIRERKRPLVGWPRDGPVDVIVTDSAGADVALAELKWGTELWNCVWDVAKMALANAELNVPTFLLAGAPAQTWSKRGQGTAYFDQGAWSARELMDQNGALFAIPAWGFPKRLPERFSADPIARTPLTINDQPWELRLARVTAQLPVISFP